MSEVPSETTFVSAPRLTRLMLEPERTRFVMAPVAGAVVNRVGERPLVVAVDGNLHVVPAGKRVARQHPFFRLRGQHLHQLLSGIVRAEHFVNVPQRRVPVQLVGRFRLDGDERRPRIDEVVMPHIVPAWVNNPPTPKETTDRAIAAMMPKIPCGHVPCPPFPD